MTITFYLHQSKTDGLATVYHRVTIKGKRAELNSTGIKIRRADWDREAKRILPSDPDAFWKNDELDIKREQLKAIYVSLFRKSRTVNPFQVKAIYENEPVTQEFSDVFSLFQEAQAKRLNANPEEKLKRKRRLSPGTLRQYETHRKKILDFLIEQKKIHLPATEFTPKLLESFLRWMSDEEQHEDAYTWKVATTIKAVTAWAASDSVIEDDPLGNIELTMPKAKLPICLTVAQFENLRDVPFTNPYMQQVADVFVLYCRTGFHYADLKTMAKAAKQEIRTGLDGKDWIYHKRIKTMVEAKVPIFAEVQMIVDKYGGWEKLPIMSNEGMNDWLKLIAAERDLYPKLSVKIGRKTFTDWLLNEKDWSEEAVAVVLGLLSTESLKPYARKDERKVLVQLKKEAEVSNVARITRRRKSLRHLKKQAA